MEDVLEQMKELAKKSLVATSGVASVKGLKDEVRIMRDQWGVPHIFAKSIKDLFFAEGYTHAQERLWQMDFNRRLACGTLSEIIGELTLDIDTFMRTIGLKRTAEAAARLIQEKGGKLIKDVMQAYVKGVNAFIESHIVNPPFEYKVLGCQPSQWNIADTSACGLLVAYQLSMN